eukprot:3542749-Alexandrium_andersonii.AAC.1
MVPGVSKAGFAQFDKAPSSFLQLCECHVVLCAFQRRPNMPQTGVNHLTTPRTTRSSWKQSV